LFPPASRSCIAKSENVYKTALVYSGIFVNCIDWFNACRKPTEITIDFIVHFSPKKFILMEKIASILSRKQSHFNHVSCSSLVSDALYKMSCQNIDYVVVIDDNENFAGLLSEHDIATKLMLSNKPLNKIKVVDVMNNRLPHAASYDTIEECMQLMQRHQTRFVPVFEDFNFVGVISSEDILSEAVHNRLEIFDA